MPAVPARGPHASPRVLLNLLMLLVHSSMPQQKRSPMVTAGTVMRSPCRELAVPFPNQKIQRYPQCVTNVCGSLKSAASISFLRVLSEAGPYKIG